MIDEQHMEITNVYS